MIALEALKVKDCAKIVEWNENKDADFLCQWAGPITYEFPISIDQIAKRVNDESLLIFKILNDNEMIGTVELRKLQNDDKSMIICCFLIDPDCTGKGFGQITLQRIKEYAFNKLKIDRLVLKVYAYNVCAIRCYEKAGFCVEEFHIAENQKWNSYLMSITKNG